jgi:hypothetical protein
MMTVRRSELLMFLLFPQRSQFTARRVPEADAGNQAGERSRPSTPPTPHWKLAVHADLSGCFPHAGRWLKKTESAARGGDCAMVLPDKRLQRKQNIARAAGEQC